MANLPAISVDGQSIIYLSATGNGTNQDPFVVVNEVDTGLVQSVTDAQLRASPLAVTQSGSWTVSTGLTPLTDAQLRATPVPVSVSGGGDATSANQITMIGHLDGLEGLLAGTLTVDTGLTPLTDAQLRATAVPVSGTFFQATQPVSLSSLPALATGSNVIGSIANTQFAVTQSGSWTVNTGLTPLTDAQLRATAVPVSGTFFQATQPISASTLPLPTGAATSANQSTIIGHIDGIESALSGTSGYTIYRNTALSNTAVQLKATAGKIAGWTLYNSNTTPVYVKVYNILAASVTVGTSAVTSTIIVPPGDGTTPGVHYQDAGLTPQIVCSTAISIAAVTGLADNSTTAPTTPIYAEVLWA